MFLSAHDGVLTLVLVFYAAALAAWGARLLGAGLMADLAAIRQALAAVAAGRRHVRAEVAGRDELARLGADVDGMIGRLEGEERARRELITAVSHDLRTPITALRLLAEAIDDGIVDDATRRDYARRMTTHVRALGALIDDLFELTQLQRGDREVLREEVDLGPLVQEAVEAMRPAADDRGVVLRSELPDAPPAAHATREELQRVLFNLLQNAIRHTPAGGSVTVTLRAPGDAATVALDVADTGGGIAPADRPRVFEPFFRGGTDASRTDAGAGLGLAISRAIVESHGGSIGLGDGAGAGTRVTVRLPRADAGRPGHG
jgi:signal transduction histidine kinase